MRNHWTYFANRPLLTFCHDEYSEQEDDAYNGAVEAQCHRNLPCVSPAEQPFPVCCSYTRLTHVDQWNNWIVDVAELFDRIASVW